MGRVYYGDPESYNHAPNEFLSIEAFRARDPLRGKDNRSIRDRLGGGKT